MARVLVVEDEPSIAAIVAHKLRREGHEVRCEERIDGDDLKVWRPDLVLLDLDLDGGIECLQRFSSGWRFLALTGFRDDVAPVRAQEAGAAAILAKPFKPTVLARLVAELTSR
ncbi:MAG TPA: response regulator [Candidatus Dormibacteraeota bacterium]|jgi:DNA-binding response OmpR family regulator|nr:response regulator [Candidatus Dormibacteraeota bacterium]